MSDAARCRRIAAAAVLAMGLAGPAAAQTVAPRADGRDTPIRAIGSRASCPPTLIFSHGFGGDENGSSGLAGALATLGWRVIAIGHRESGREALAAAMRSPRPFEGIAAALTTRELHAARFLDLDAAVAFATARCRPKPFVMAGHSMGAITVMLEAGAAARFGRFGADRFDAYVALSPQGVGTVYDAGAWAGVRKPVLMITGTRDNGTDGDYRTRLSAFDGLPPGRKRLAILTGARHLSLAGNEGDQYLGALQALIHGFGSAAAAAGPRPDAAPPGVELRDK
ncbi:MAG: alpha/beta hydrolase family protein [Beijerinckiaceae bacterium]